MIFLVGYRAVGKTTIGRQLAKKFAWDFIDLDEWICHNAGMSVSEIVEKEGWQGFRAREKELLQQSFKLSDSIISTGGGAVLHQEVWAIDRPESLTVWLQADVKVICERLLMADPEQRPSLTNTELLEEVESVLSERLPLYENVADLKVSTDVHSIDEVALIIAEAYDKMIEKSS